MTLTREKEKISMWNFEWMKIFSMKILRYNFISTRITILIQKKAPSFGWKFEYLISIVQPNWQKLLVSSKFRFRSKHHVFLPLPPSFSHSLSAHFFLSTIFFLRHIYSENNERVVQRAYKYVESRCSLFCRYFFLTFLV